MTSHSGNVRALPHDAHAEVALLGSVLLDNQVLAWLRDRVAPADFYTEAARATYAAMLELAGDGLVIDATTLLARVSPNKAIQAAGGAHFLLGLTDRIPSATNFRTYANLILKHSDLRRTVEQLLRASERAHDTDSIDDVGVFLDDVLRSVEGVRDRASTRLIDNLDELAPARGATYGLDELELDEQCELLDLSTLPAWPAGAPPHGHGVGPWLGRKLGGVRPGEIVMIGASTAKAGKTAFLMQLADGLALRTADIVQCERKAPLTPVFVCSEMSSRQLSWRSLARWTGYDSRIYRAGRSAVQLVADTVFNGALIQAQQEVAAAFRDARQALQPDSLFGASRTFVRDLKPGTRLQGPALLDHVARLVSAWRRELERQHGREVWPVVVLDPIQRWQEHGANEIDALNELTEVLNGLCLDEGLIVLLTSDSTKAAATGQNTREGAGLLEQARASFRGSYKLQHVVSHGLYLHRPEPEEPDLVEAVVAIQRWGSGLPPWPRYRWSLKNGRFSAQAPDAPAADSTSESQRLDEATPCPLTLNI